MGKAADIRETGETSDTETAGQTVETLSESGGGRQKSRLVHHPLIESRGEVRPELHLETESMGFDRPAILHTQRSTSA